MWFEVIDQIGAKDDGNVYQHDYSVELCYGCCIIMKGWGCERKEKRHTSYVSLRLNKLVEVGLDEAKPLFDAAFNVTTTLLDISNESS